MKIHLVKTRYSNTYVIEEHGRLLVADVAMRCDGYVLAFITEELKREIEAVDLVVCTHDDPDHIGGVIALARSCHATAAIPHASKRASLKFYNNPMGPVVKIATTIGEAFRARSRNMYMDRERNQRYQHVPNHHLEVPTAQRFILPKQRLVNGMKLEGFPNWEVVHTPGHSWDSICFYHRPSRSLITGDTLLGSGTKGQLVHPAIYDNRRAMRTTLETLRKLDPQTVYPGHGSVFSGDDLLSHL
ncbi:MAG: glyoxylase-like metal-dependent hydrolase (beta-lactamase superfamily II) [Candidatus Azotimanducaceae bacterium]|jgi:hydroxyacylglutathione hydrolase